MEHCCLLAFVIDSWEETYKGEEVKGQEEVSETRAGRPAHVRAQYMPDHPKMRTHRRVYRAKGHNTLPQIAGPWFPRSDDPSIYDFYCACILALLKPWRRAHDLKKENEEWEETFARFENNASPEHKRIIAGIQYYYESKTACDSNTPEVDKPWHGRLGSQQRGNDLEQSDAMNSAMEETMIALTEEDLQVFRRDQVSPREESHAEIAIQIAIMRGVFDPSLNPPSNSAASSIASYRIATGDDNRRLLEWLNSMREMTASIESSGPELPTPTTGDSSNVSELSQALFGSDTGHTCLLANLADEAHSLTAASPDKLLEDQRRAYDIIDWHLHQYLAGKCPRQMRMIIPGEAGVGKSKTIQTITANFVARGVGNILVKAAYTGLAASVIDGKTLHHVAMLPLHGAKQSPKTIKALETYWQDKHYLIIDEISMVSRKMFAKLSRIISRAKEHQGKTTDEPFGGLNVIVVGDFHQFPPVAAKPTAPLYCPCDAEKDSDIDMLGRKLYEQFDQVVRLKTQVRVTDSEWLDLLQHVQYGSCTEAHLSMLRELVLAHEGCPSTDFGSLPWSEALLITPRHAVRMKWNSMTVKARCIARGVTLIKCPAFDTIQGRKLTLEEKFAVAAKPKSGRGRNRRECAGLADKVEIAIGMEVMVTFNVSTDLDVANGARGHIVDIVLDPREELSNIPSNSIELQYSPIYVLVAMIRTKAVALQSLATGVLPITPLVKTFSVVTASGNKITVAREQLPVTPAYAFTDYRSQAQTIEHCIVDLGMPPTGKLTPFNAYVALSRSRGRNSIRLLRDFDERLFTRHPSEYLRLEDERLGILDRRTKEMWTSSRNAHM